MGHLKRSLPKNERSNFRVKSSLSAFGSKPQGSSIREQESTIAGYYRKPLGEKFEQRERRDDSSLGNHPEYGEGFICLTNKLTVFELVELSDKYRKNGLVSPSKRAEFRAMVKYYVQSLRESGNFCMVCEQPLKASKHIVLDKDELERRDELSPIEVVMESKQRLSFKKSAQRKYKAYGVILTRKHKFTERAIVRRSPDGETKLSAKVGARELFYLALPDGRMANLDYIFKFKSVVVGQFDKHERIINSTKNLCACKK